MGDVQEKMKYYTRGSAGNVPKSSVKLECKSPDKESEEESQNPLDQDDVSGSLTDDGAIKCSSEDENERTENSRVVDIVSTADSNYAEDSKSSPGANELSESSSDDKGLLPVSDDAEKQSSCEDADINSTSNQDNQEPTSIADSDATSRE